MASDILIQHGLVIDPTQEMETHRDVLIKNGRIHRIDEKISPSKNMDVIDAENQWVVPGLVDMHVHLREPGFEYKETILSGARAAAAGGFTAIACMPNTQPVNDTQAVTDFMIHKAMNTPVKVHPIAAITRAMAGKELTEMADLIAAGAVAFSDDGVSVRNAEVLRRALEYSKIFDALIIEHSEDEALSRDGVVHEGIVSTSTGLPGIPAIAEDTVVDRNIKLAEYTGGRIHIAHVSTARSAELIRDAKKRGVRVSAEVTPHHLFLNEDAAIGFDTDTKMKPPLRSEHDRLALVDALIDGTIDCIATDHAPHAPHEKEVEFTYAPFGVIGLETALSLVLTRLVHTQKMSRSRLVEVMSLAPATLLRLEAGNLQPGSPADITIIDPEHYWIVDESRFLSKSRNTPFKRWSLRGAARLTMVNGTITFNRQDM